jgi:hypothetical protein
MEPKSLFLHLWQSLHWVFRSLRKDETAQKKRTKKKKRPQKHSTERSLDVFS